MKFVKLTKAADLNVINSHLEKLRNKLFLLSDDMSEIYNLVAQDAKNNPNKYSDSELNSFYKVVKKFEDLASGSESVGVLLEMLKNK